MEVDELLSFVLSKWKSLAVSLKTAQTNPLYNLANYVHSATGSKQLNKLCKTVIKGI